MGYETMALGSFLSYVSEISQDILYIIYLIFYGVYAFAVLPCKHWLLPLWLKPVDNEIILILGHQNPLMTEICQRLCSKAKKLVVWTDLESECDSVSSFPNEGVLKNVQFDERESLEEAADQLENEVGTPTIVINTLNSYCPKPGKLLCQSNDETMKIMQINLTTNFWVARKFLPKMIEMNKGHFVQISNFPRISWGVTNCVPYIGSLCGTVGFVQSLRDSIKHHMDGANIKFTTVNHYLPRMKDFSKKESTKSNLAIRLQNITDSELAERIITGFRRNKENVYVPCSFGIILWLENFLPLQFIQKLQMYFVTEA